MSYGGQNVLKKRRPPRLFWTREYVILYILQSSRPYFSLTNKTESIKNPWVWVFWYIFTAQTGAPADCPEVNIDYYGNDLQGPVIAETWQDCSDYCRTLQGCNYWSYVSDSFPTASMHKACFLKTSNSGRQASFGVLSGSRDCGGTYLSFVERATFY